MDTAELRETLGDTGVAGAALLLVGLLIVSRENRRAGLGAAAVVAGLGLVGHGIVGSFLASMGMSYDDL
ncbi:MAG: hypothetical protein RI560_09610 [Natronomonas sp.]|uniref:DUF7470 family protein n=1 Tax=Natronomonas sp. TaxID=2184060 RepID=UPI0028706389|nr:hypothetical protein [Natronomonas sp.]MDR9381907.1 hypothetical protein [Natronomonas sp.]MDR9431266.1 hypothetical protein [Natronomonas sp.]